MAQQVQTGLDWIWIRLALIVADVVILVKPHVKFEIASLVNNTEQVNYCLLLYKSVFIELNQSRGFSTA